MYSRLAEVMLGAVFCVSGVLKAADRNWPAAAAAFGGPAWLARPLPWAEMALGGCLVAGLARPLPSVTAAALLVAFTGAIPHVPRGRARVVLHDLREGSPTEGGTLTLDIGDGDERGVFIPPGVAHGFAALTDLTLTYLVDRYYDPEDELGVAWDDPAIGVDWGVAEPVLSARDRDNPARDDLPPG